MCCIGYVISLAFGVVVLAKGRLSLTSSRVLVGRPAYYVGGMLIGMFPIVFVMRLIIFGVLTTLMGPVPNPAALALWAEVVAAAIYFAIVCIVAFTTSIPTSQSVPTPQQWQSGVAVGSRPVTLQAPPSANRTEQVREPLQPLPNAELAVRLGIASLALSLVTGAMLCVLFVIAALMSASQPSGMKDDSVEAILIGCGLLLGLALELVAFGLCLAALMQGQKPPLSGILGLIFSVVIVLLVVLAVVAGMAAATNQPRPATGATMSRRVSLPQLSPLLGAARIQLLHRSFLTHD
jgi:hypothetical protein